ncbi:Uncharacterised protein (plasmid) [Klebsiella aerogenes]|nr:Uncharacterised protein [Klebsiella aerogenes]
MKGDNISLREKVFEYINTFASGRNRGGIRIVSQHLHTEGAGNFRHPTANRPQTNQPQRFAFQFERFMRRFIPVPFAQAAVKRND